MTVTRRPCALAAVIGTLLALGSAAPVQARDDSISSFDGTRIVLSFFPADGLKAGQKASGRRPDGSRVRFTKRVAKRRVVKPAR